MPHLSRGVSVGAALQPAQGRGFAGLGGRQACSPVVKEADHEAS